MDSVHRKCIARIAHHNGMNIQYLSGKVAGDMVYETVKMGDVTVKNQVRVSAFGQGAGPVLCGS